MNLDDQLYNEKLEKKYFYLPKICRKSNNYNKELYSNSNVSKNKTITYLLIFNNIQNDRIFELIFKRDEIISKNIKEINKIKEDSISTMIIENKPIPEKWKNKPSYLKIMKKVLKNEDMKTIAVTNMKNNIIKAEYNKNLKDNLPKIMDKFKVNSSYEYDNDLMTLVNSRRSNIKKDKRFQSIHEEYKDMIKKQNLKIEPPRPDSLRENLKNIVEYRKKMALRFKYNNYNIKIDKGKNNSLLPKSRSQILNSKQSLKYNTISTSDNKSIKDNSNNKNYIFRNRSNFLKNNLSNKEKNSKEYEDKFMITGMNNKKFKDTIIIEEEPISNIEINENYQRNNIKKSESVFY